MLRNLLYDNRSYRCFDESKPVPQDKILNWIDNARFTPSACNRQPLKYKVLDAKGVEKLCRLPNGPVRCLISSCLRKVIILPLSL